MLPKSNRLIDKRDFKRVITQGSSFFVKEFWIKIFKTNQRLPVRIGIIIPKKIAKTIVKRNRIKRQVRHVFINLIDAISSGYDIVLFARADFLKLKFKEMEEKIVYILEKAGCLR